MTVTFSARIDLTVQHTARCGPILIKLLCVDDLLLFVYMSLGREHLTLTHTLSVYLTSSYLCELDTETEGQTPGIVGLLKAIA